MRAMKWTVGAMLTMVVGGARGVLAQGDAPPVRTQGSVSYVSGGVSSDERDALRAISGQFNLQVAVVRGNGEYVGDAPIRITDAQGQTVLDVVTNGPILYAHLVPGTYGVSTKDGGKDVRQTAHVAATGLRQLIFRVHAP